MTNNMATKFPLDSAFHLGEQLIQEKLGQHQRMAEIGNKFIRDHMPEQHIEFFTHLSYIFVGHLDETYNPWATMFFQEKNLVAIPNNKTLIISTLHNVNIQSTTFKIGDNIGLLGIDLSNKRRNRLSGYIENITASTMHIKVKQSFGNCAKYINNKYLSHWQSTLKKEKTQHAAQRQFDNQMVKLMTQSDAFYVASYYHDPKQPLLASNGVDISYRGGHPGFVKVVSSTKLVIPDYIGNNFFNTLGNIEQTGKAALLFINDKTGDVLSMTGTAEILWHKIPTKSSKGAQRFWRFSMQKAYWQPQALPFTFTDNIQTKKC